MNTVKDNKEGIQKAAHIINNGGVVAFPTETSYGLACDMTNDEALARIYEIKKRDTGKPLPAIVASLEMAEQHCVLSEKASELAGAHWPGPLTLVVQLKEDSPIVRLPEQVTLAVRVSSHPVAQQLTELAGVPIAATSANIAGQDNIYEPEELMRIFAHAQHTPDLLIDAGVLPTVKPSTIVKALGGAIDIIRSGTINIT